MSLEAKFYICVAFGLGFVFGYLVKKRLKLSPREFDFQLSRLDGVEVANVSARLQKSWQIPNDLLIGKPPGDPASEEKKA
jgi:hypothetical protein